MNPPKPRQRLCQRRAAAQCRVAGLPVDICIALGHPSPMSSTMPVGARDLLRHGPFLFFLLSRSLSRFASQIAAVAIGWQIYDITGSAFQLGMVGLVQFLPTALLVLSPATPPIGSNASAWCSFASSRKRRRRCFWPSAPLPAGSP